MKTKFKQPHHMHDDPETALNLTELASDLAQEANLYVMATDDLPDLTGAELGNQLAKMLSTETIKFFMEAGDYGRGFLSGLAVGVATLEFEVDRQLAVRQDEIGEDDDLADEDMEEIILNGLKHGVRGGGKTDDGEEH